MAAGRLRIALIPLELTQHGYALRILRSALREKRKKIFFIVGNFSYRGGHFGRRLLRFFR